MKKIKNWLLMFALVLMPLSFVLTGCGISIGGGGESLLADDVYVSESTLNGGKMSETVNPGGSIGFRKFMNLPVNQYHQYSHHLLNHYNVEYAYEMHAVTNDVTKEGKVFGGWYLDKDCTVGNYLTEASYKRIREKEGDKSLPLYARWLNPGERDIIFEADGVNFVFSEAFKSANTVVDNQFRFTCTQENYNANSQNIENAFPVPEITKAGEVLNHVSKNIFTKWQLDFNGLRYDYKDQKFISLINTYSDSFMEAPIHNFSYSNFFRDNNAKPYALLKPGYRPATDNSIRVFFNENGGKWDSKFDYNDGYVKADKWDAMSANTFELTIYDDFVNHAKTSQKKIGNPPRDQRFKPVTNDITREGKVFAGWYLDKECTAENYFCKKTWETKILPNFAKLGYEFDLYARWIDVGQREIIFERESGLERITFTQADVEQYKGNAKYTLDGYKVDFNGLLIDYATGEFPNVPETFVEGTSPEFQYLKPIEDSYYTAFNYDNLMQNGASKPYAYVTMVKA